MYANPAFHSLIMFVIGTALTLGDVHSRVWASACWILTAVLLLVAFFQWIRWPGNYGFRLQSLWYLRWGGRVSLRKAAEILYTEARLKSSIWASAAERLSADTSPDGILCYIATAMSLDTTFYGRRPPSTHVEALDPAFLKRGSVENGAREVHMHDGTKAVFTDLEVSTKDLRRNLKELIESYITN